MALLVEYTEPQWRDLNMRALKVDQAYFYIKSFAETTTYLYSLVEDCYTCPFSFETSIPPLRYEEESTKTLQFNVARSVQFKLLQQNVGPYAFDNSSSLCTWKLDNLKEFGVYNLTLNYDGSCDFAEDKAGVSVNFAFCSVLLILATFLILLKAVRFCWKYFDEEGNDVVITTSMDTLAGNESVKRKRMQSLDAFRGFAIVLMIFVNSGGGDYWWMEHATWNGLHVADIVFPSFLWIMGVCIPISIKSQLSRGVTKLKICQRIIWRSVKLFLIGLCLNSLNGPEMENLRIMGVLQRFSIAYLFCGIIHTIFHKVNYTAVNLSPARSALHDVLVLKGEFLIMLSLIGVYLGIIFGLKVPGCPKGYLGPGGKDKYAMYPDCVTGGATGYIDFKVLGKTHMYQHPTAKYVYNSTAFDPEGMFGCCLTIVQVFFGILAGVIILAHSEWSTRIRRWLLWSVLLGLLGGSLAGFSQENGVIPINKNLWSLSFVFVTVSLAFFMLSVLYYFIDIKTLWKGYPFVESGMNAIIMYVGHTIMHKMLPWHWRIGPMNTHFILLLEATWNTLLWIFIAIYLDHINYYYSL